MTDGHVDGSVTIYGIARPDFYQILCRMTGTKHAFALVGIAKVKENLHFFFKML